MTGKKPDPVRYRATLAYDGTAYQGFQRQAAGITTIQGAVEDAIAVVSGQAVTITGAGRTDTGVHATGQVVAFDVSWSHPDDALLRAINANLPDDIALQDICQQAGFHPRFDAVGRLYRYHVISASQRQPLLRHRVWQVRNALDLKMMQAAAAKLAGTHDFAAFGQPPQGDNTVREIMTSQWTAEHKPYGKMFVYEVEANAFLRHMVRRLVGTLVDVGRGRLDLSEFEDILLSADLSRAKTVAPPQGLVLARVRYPNDIWRSRRPPEERT